MKRATKFAAFSVFGTILANAAALAGAALVGIDAPAPIITTVSLIAGSAAAGIQKAVAWQDYGVDPPPAPTLTPPDGGAQ